MKNTDYQKKVLVLCEAALETAHADRATLLDAECANLPGLRADVEAMLERVQLEESEAETDSARYLLGTPALHAARPGDDIADFRLQAKIGSGGMGDVYRASRLNAAFEQDVAIKVLHAQILTPELRLRFNREREILARMHHPYIAGLIDGGTTEHGVPYLVMEFINGVPIDTYCDQQRLPMNERLILLEKVATALQYAHQNMTIHRDIKPGNVLVTNDGIPKLVDFGIAKLVANPTTGASGATTLFGSHVFTPDYASPEQILEGEVSTSSDIYSLGTLAIEILTGRRPRELGKLSAAGLINTLENSPTPHASTLLKNSAAQPSIEHIASVRATTPRALKRILKGDLDMVLGQATNRLPGRRYANAEDFGRDLANVRRGYRVMARSDSLGYRIWSFIRTYRLAVSVTGATVFALSVGLMAALWQARIAEERFVDLHSFARAVLGDIYDSIVDLPGSTPTRKLITDEAQHYLDRLASSNLDDPQLQSVLALSYKRLADVQGLPTNANLGNSTNALANYYKAEELVERIRNETPEQRRVRAQIYKRMADVLAWQGDLNAAHGKIEQALTLFRQLHADAPDSPQAVVDLAYTLTKLGDALGHPSFPNLGKTAEASSAFADGLALVESAVALSTAPDWELRRTYSVLLERSGTMALVSNDTPKALSLFTRSHDVRVALARARPDHTDIQRDAGVASEKLADVYQASGDLTKALSQYRTALGVYKRLAEIDPENANAQRTLAIGRENLAEALVNNGDFTAARSQYTQALEIHAKLVEQDPDSPHLRTRLAKTQATLKALSEPL